MQVRRSVTYKTHNIITSYHLQVRQLNYVSKEDNFQNFHPN